MTAPGCAALALPVVGMSVMSDAAESAVKAGVEHTMGGAAYRTFSAPLADVRAAVRQSFRDLEIQITEDELLIGGGAKIVGEALHPEITLRLGPATPPPPRPRMARRPGPPRRGPPTAAPPLG